MESTSLHTVAHSGRAGIGQDFVPDGCKIAGYYWAANFLSWIVSNLELFQKVILTNTNTPGVQGMARPLWRDCFHTIQGSGVSRDCNTTPVGENRWTRFVTGRKPGNTPGTTVSLGYRPAPASVKV